jgi:N-methylhydantoinase B
VCATIVGGIDDRTGEPFAVVEPQPGGWGGGEGKDGESGMFYLGNGETYAMPVEVLEARTPIRCERYMLDRDAARGAGRSRGGLGVIKEYRIANSHATFTASFGRSKFPAWGAAGGEGGSPNFFVVEKVGESPRRLSKVAALPLSEGDLIRMHTGSGGGFGDPRGRDPERVAADVREGFVSPDRARDAYGVVLTDDGRVDDPATQATREE